MHGQRLDYCDGRASRGRYLIAFKVSGGSKIEVKQTRIERTP
jgi:hypothetical protein